MEQRAKYPVGIQTFEKIRKGGYLYIDKTKYVYDLANSSQYVFFHDPGVSENRFSPARSMRISAGERTCSMGLLPERLRRTGSNIRC